jgi:DivIVA domain-containing protein
LIFKALPAIIKKRERRVMAKVNLDIQSILDKQFNIDFRGYSAEEVDAYLDLVIEDYQTYQEITGELNEKIEELERTNASLRAKLIEVEGRTRALEANPTPAQQGADNLDILKRLSRLEDEVFAQQRDRRE